MPREANKPVIAKWEYSQNATIILSITSDAFSLEDLRGKVDNLFKSSFKRIDGVANVDVWGGRERKILVEMDQAKLASFNIGYEKVMTVLGNNNLNLLVGEVEGIRSKFLIRTIGLFATIDDVRNIGIGVTHRGSIIRLKDVATVEDSYMEPTAFARINLYDNVSVYVSKESSANTLSVTSSVRKETAKILAESKEDIKVNFLYDQGEYIEEAISAVKKSLLIGGLLAMIVLLVYLRDIAATAVIALSIPISIIATFIFMNFFGITLNIMTLSGLALGTGMLVDNSIVVLENIFHKRQKGFDIKTSAINGSEEVWLAILASTITTIAVFLPMIFIDKDIRILYSGLALTVTFSIMASLFVSLSLVPMLYYQSARFWKFGKKKEFIQKIAQKMYQEALLMSIRYRYIFLLLIVVLFALSIIRVTSLGMEMTGQMSKGQFSINFTPPPGTKLEKVDEVVRKVEAMLSEIPEIETISANVKRDNPKLLVSLVPLSQRTRSKQEIVDLLRLETSKIPKFFIYFYTGAQESDTKEIVIDIFGHDYIKLKTLANSVGKEISSLPYLTDVKLRMRNPRPEYGLVVDKHRAAYYGLSVRKIADTVHGQVRGLRATKFHSDAHEIEMIARLQKSDRKNLQDLENLVVSTKKGNIIRLKQVAGLIPTRGPTEIYRRNKSRYIQVTASIEDKDLGSVAVAVEKLLEGIKFPKDYFYRFGGDYPILIKSRNQLSGAIGVTILLVYMILASLFQSYYQPFIIMISVPLAVIGVVLALQFTDNPLSTSVFIGMIMLAGIVVNNAIILVDHANNLKKQGKKRFRIIIQAGKDRLRPIFMTTTTTVLGLIPMALSTDGASDLWAPLAITVMGGLLSSTFLTLIVIPNIYILFEDINDIFKYLFTRKDRKKKGVIYYE